MVRESQNQPSSETSVPRHGKLDVGELKHPPRDDKARNVSESTEIEVKFFAPEHVIKSITRGTPAIKLEQHYFPKEVVRKLKEELTLHALVDSSDEFTVARIRRTLLPCGKVDHQIEFKGPKDGICRREFGIDISRDVYRGLLKLATAGSVEKRRFQVQGHIEYHGQRLETVAEVDVIRKAGRPASPLPVLLGTIDVEISSVDSTRAGAVIAALRKGKHSFDFLRECVELMNDDRDLGRALTTRKLAKHGFDSERRAAVEELKSAAKALSKD